MTLVCRAYGSPEEGVSVDAAAVPLTPEFLQILRERQRLVGGAFRLQGAATLDSALFHEATPQWLSWSEDLEEVLKAAEATDWCLLEDGPIAIAESGDDADRTHAVRTDCEFIQVWPERFQFRCCLRNTDTPIQSAMLYFDDIFAAATHHAPAAQRRPAA